MEQNLVLLDFLVLIVGSPRMNIWANQYEFLTGFKCSPFQSPDLASLSMCPLLGVVILSRQMEKTHENAHFNNMISI